MRKKLSSRGNKMYLGIPPLAWISLGVVAVGMTLAFIDLKSEDQRFCKVGLVLAFVGMCAFLVSW